MGMSSSWHPELAVRPNFLQWPLKIDEDLH